MQSESGDSHLLITDQIGAVGHTVPEGWLRSRVRGWIDLTESPWRDYWIGTYTADGRWIHCSSNADTWAPNRAKQDFAMKVCAHLNRKASAGGAWLVGWLLDGQRFYLLWKDAQGDISIPIENDKPFSVIREWSLENFETQAINALHVRGQFEEVLDLIDAQRVKRAQGEKPSANHLSEGLRVAGLT